MTLIKENKDLVQEKNINLLLDTCNFWRDELLFLTMEIQFFKKMLKSYPFPSNTPNLFERIELFVQDFNTILSDKDTVLEDLRMHKNLLKEFKTSKTSDSVNLLLTQHKNIEKRIVSYFINYKTHKKNFYEFMISLIN